jgi:opacity protein-like surface antigen
MQRRNIPGSTPILVILILVILSAAAMAADITGSWAGTMSIGDNKFTLTYSFKQDGGTLTGSVVTPSGDALPLSEGKVDGDKISFAVKTEMNGAAVKFVSSGTIKDEEITITTKAEGNHDFPETPMTLKRTH